MDLNNTIATGANRTWMHSCTDGLVGSNGEQHHSATGRTICSGSCAVMRRAPVTAHAYTCAAVPRPPFGVDGDGDDRFWTTPVEARPAGRHCSVPVAYSSICEMRIHHSKFGAFVCVRDSCRRTSRIF